MKPVILLGLAIMLLCVGGVSAQNKKEPEHSLSFQFEGEDFDTLVSAWQEIKIHNFYHLQLDSKDTDVFPAGEVFDFDKNLYSTGYVLVTQKVGLSSADTYHTQVDVIISAGVVTIKYSILSGQSSDYGRSQIQMMSQEYEKHIRTLMSKFSSYLQGSHRLMRLYHGAQ